MALRVRFLMGCRAGGWIMPRRDRACRRARGRQGRCAPLTRWPEDGPSLTAAARAGTWRAQVGTEGWRRSNRRMERKRQSSGCRHLCGRNAARRLLGEISRATASHTLWRVPEAEAGSGTISRRLLLCSGFKYRACAVSDRRGDSPPRICRVGRRRSGQRGARRGWRCGRGSARAARRTAAGGRHR